MDLDGDLAERIRAVLAGTGIVRKVRMVGGLCFMVNGNMVAGTSKHGLLVRVGKDQHSRALAVAAVPGPVPAEVTSVAPMRTAATSVAPMRTAGTSTAPT